MSVLGCVRKMGTTASQPASGGAAQASASTAHSAEAAGADQRSYPAQEVIMGALDTAAVLSEHGAIVLGQQVLHRHLRRGTGAGWSHYHCVGDIDTDLSAHEKTIPRPWFPLTRSCIFSNVCWVPAKDEWLYYENASSPNAGASRATKFGSRFLATSSGGARHGDVFALKVVRRRQPSSSHIATTVVRGLTALMGERFAPNIGHFVWDNAFALLTTMAQLGVYTGELNVLRTSVCMSSPSVRSFASSLCDELAEAFLAPLNGLRPDSPTRGWVRTLKQLQTVHATSERICFEQLQAGGAFNAFDSEPLNVGREGLVALYRHRVLQWHGLDALAPRPAVPPRILLVQKSSKRAESGRQKRSISNFDEVNQYVRARFGQRADVHETTFADMPFADQLRLITSTSVAFSPCGGISMLLPFLPPGAHAILVNYVIRTANPRYIGAHGECAVSDTRHPTHALALRDLLCAHRRVATELLMDNGERTVAPCAPCPCASLSHPGRYRCAGPAAHQGGRENEQQEAGWLPPSA